MTLPAALTPLAVYRQWIVYRTEPSTTPGKLNKQPVDWRTGELANAHDPAIWVGYDEALEAARKLGLGVGFVFTDADPFWFVDVDNCLTPQGWSPLAQEICTLLAGAAVEISISGKGLHVIGVGKVPPHASRSPLGIEFYHTARFMALGTGAQFITQGATSLTDCSEALAVLVDRYFERRAKDAPNAAWTAAPCAQWRGPADDDELVRRMLRSKGAASAFGNKASAADLWDGNAEALTRAFPDAARGYDASSADAALAQHLAFWTGKDCARIERLMRRSKLARDKWDQHASYMQRTVLQAVAQQTDVLIDKPPEAAAPESVTAIRDVNGETWLTPDDQKIMFAGCVYISSEHAIQMRDGTLYKEGPFNALCGGFSYVLDRKESKLAKSAWHAFLDSRDVRFPKVSAREFAPARAVGEIWTDGNTSRVNAYVPITVPSKDGNPAPFLDHLAKLCPKASDRAILLAYMAAVVQHPGVKFQWAPLLQGCEGNGKSLLSRCVIEAVGRAHCHVPKPKELSSRFNDWIAEKLFIGIEDVPATDDGAIMEALTTMITNDWLEIEGKGSTKASRRVCANFILNTNHKGAIRKTRDGRRIAVFFTAQQGADDLKKHGMSGNYFPDLYNWLRRDGYAIVTHYLRHYAIPAALNPATECHRAPDTTSTAEAIHASVGALEQEIIEAILQEQVGFRDGWVSSHYLDALIRAQRMEAKYPRNRRGLLMLELGYKPHPGLEASGGQVHNVVAPDGVKPRLYIMHAGHPAEDAVGAEVARLYTEAQTRAPMVPGLRLAASGGG